MKQSCQFFFQLVALTFWGCNAQLNGQSPCSELKQVKTDELSSIMLFVSPQLIDENIVFTTRDPIISPHEFRELQEVRCYQLVGDQIDSVISGITLCKDTSWIFNLIGFCELTYKDGSQTQLLFDKIHYLENTGNPDNQVIILNEFVKMAKSMEGN
jgi:hypothetical protein